MTARNVNARRTPSGMTHSEIRDQSTDTHKHCSVCGQFKPLTSFVNSTRGFKGRHASCTDCMYAYQKLWRDEKYNADRLKIQNKALKVRRVYGEDGLLVLKRIIDGEPCEICGGYTSKMAIDHDHNTGKVRGLLCGNCNSALGLLKESETTIMNLLAYMRKHKS